MIELPEIIKKYVEGSNKHDVKAILGCFIEEATVHDEGEQLHGKKAIRNWILKTIDKYKFQFKPLSVKEDDTQVVATIEVSGTFDGSPITIDYHFTIENGKIAFLEIK